LRVCLYGKAGNNLRSKSPGTVPNQPPYSRLSGNQKIEGSLTNATLSLEKPFAAATQQYQEAQSQLRELWKAKDQLRLRSNQIPPQRLPNLIRKCSCYRHLPQETAATVAAVANRLQRLTAELDLRLGLYKCNRTERCSSDLDKLEAAVGGSKPSVIA